MADFAAKNMNAKLRTNNVFTSAVLKQTAMRIRADQARVAGQLNTDTGELSKSLQGNFDVSASGNGAKLDMEYLNYFRYLDMKDIRRVIKPGGYNFYNRLVFSTVYNYTLSNLLYGLTDEFRAILTPALEAAADLPFYKQVDVAMAQISKFDRKIVSKYSSRKT